MRRLDGMSENKGGLSSLFPDLPGDVLAVSCVAFRALRNGERLVQDELAQRAGCDQQTVRGVLFWLDEAGLLERDAQGSIVGLLGLTQQPSVHSLVLDGQNLHTWCAIDAVGIPAALSLSAHVITACAQCGAMIEVDVERGRPPSYSPLAGWIPPADCNNIRADLCPVANLFCSLQHLEQWRDEAGNPAGEAADLARIAEVGRLSWGVFAEYAEHVPSEAGGHH